MEKDDKKPEGGANETTIEKNLEEMDYPTSEDMMQQNEQMDIDLETTDKKVADKR